MKLVTQTLVKLPYFAGHWVNWIIFFPSKKKSRGKLEHEKREISVYKNTYSYVPCTFKCKK